MQEETTENTAGQKIQGGYNSREKYKRTREVTFKETEDYLRRPINKISDLNLSLKRSYGKKQLQKRREDSVSSHGDTDDEDFELNEGSKNSKKKKQAKGKERAKGNNKQQARNASKVISHTQIQKKSIDQESEIIAEQTLEQRIIPQAHQLKRNEEMKEGEDNVNEDKNQVGESQNEKQPVINAQRSESDKEYDKEQSASRKESEVEQSGKIQQKQADQQLTNQNQPKEQSDCEDPQSQEKQEQEEKEDLADRIKNVLTNQEQSQEEVKLTTFKKFNKKKGRKVISKQKLVKAPKQSQTRKSLKKEIVQQFKIRNLSESKSKSKRKGRNAKIAGKVQVKQSKKISPLKIQKQEVKTEPIKTRKAQGRNIIEQDKEQEVIRRSTRKRRNQSFKETQLNLKGGVADMSNHPPLIEQKTRKIQEEILNQQPYNIESGQQKIDKFMVMKTFETNNQSQINNKNTQNEAIQTFEFVQNPIIESSKIKVKSQQTIINFLDERRKNLKINNKVIIQSIVCYEKKKNHKSKKHKYKTIIEESSGEDAQEYVVARRKHKYNDIPKVKKYRKVVIEDSDSEDEARYILGKKHKKDRRKYEIVEEQSPMESRQKKRKYKHIVDSSESKSAQAKQIVEIK